MSTFKFTIPVAQQFTTSGQTKTAYIGEYYVEVEYTDFDDFDYNVIQWDGKDIFHLVVNTTEGDAILSKLDDAVRNHAAYLLSDDSKID